jgi:hypothetical protein
MLHNGLGDSRISFLVLEHCFVVDRQGVTTAIEGLEGYIHVWLATAHGDTSLSYFLWFAGSPRRLFFSSCTTSTSMYHILRNNEACTIVSRLSGSGCFVLVKRYLIYNTQFPNPLLWCLAYLIVCKHTSTCGNCKDEKDDDDDDSSNNPIPACGPRRLPLFPLNSLSPILFFVTETTPH